MEKEGSPSERVRGHPVAFQPIRGAGQTDISEGLSEALTRWAEAVLTNPAITGRTMARTFVKRAQGDMRNGKSVRWNRAANRFEAVPWSLEARHQGTLPQGAVEIGDPTGMRLCGLWAAARQSGCRVTENRAFDAPPNEEPWFCTLELQVGDGHDERPILSIWQKKSNFARKSCPVVEREQREPMDERLRTWIEAIAPKTQSQSAWLPMEACSQVQTSNPARSIGNHRGIDLRWGICGARTLILLSRRAHVCSFILTSSSFRCEFIRVKVR